MAHEPSQITLLLKAWRGGDARALDRLTPLVYDHLRHMASRYVVKERIDRQLNATALVHEAYIKLVDAGNVDWQDRAHFFAIAARSMRRILVDAARERTAAKRGGGAVPLAQSSTTLDRMAAPETDRAADICALDDALAALAAVDPERAQVVELRFFGGPERRRNRRSPVCLAADGNAALEGRPRLAGPGNPRLNARLFPLYRLSPEAAPCSRVAKSQ